MRKYFCWFLGHIWHVHSIYFERPIVWPFNEAPKIEDPMIEYKCSHCGKTKE